MIRLSVIGRTAVGSEFSIISANLGTVGDKNRDILSMALFLRRCFDEKKHRHCNRQAEAGYRLIGCVFAGETDTGTVNQSGNVHKDKRGDGKYRNEYIRIDSMLEENVFFPERTVAGLL